MIAVGGLIYLDLTCHSNRNYVSSILLAPRWLQKMQFTRNGQFSADQNRFPLTGGPQSAVNGQRVHILSI